MTGTSATQHTATQQQSCALTGLGAVLAHAAIVGADKQVGSHENNRLRLFDGAAESRPVGVRPLSVADEGADSQLAVLQVDLPHAVVVVVAAQQLGAVSRGSQAARAAEESLVASSILESLVVRHTSNRGHGLCN